MKSKYHTSNIPSPRVSELPTITATELKNSTADVFEQVAARRAVAVTRHDKPRIILLSVEQYEELTGGQPGWLGELHAKYRGMLDDMQGPEQRAAAERAFNATPEGLGEAALAGARRNAAIRKSNDARFQ